MDQLRQAETELEDAKEQVEAVMRKAEMAVKRAVVAEEKACKATQKASNCRVGCQASRSAGKKEEVGSRGPKERCDLREKNSRRVEKKGQTVESRSEGDDRGSSDEI